ncbi:erythroferrone isoform X3 [Nerophis ophidion]|uniref:erythroferrone isoform X3 n=1 Tax=Nerophis ophidion TaxID=159077 RepID=UPI002ADF1B4A|nr:erythroferrone isoform X3 [Nerophis ophidion]
MLLLLRMMMVMMMMMSGSQEVVVQPAEVQDVSPASSWLMFLNNANKEASKRTPKGPPGPQGSLLPGQQQVKLADVTSKTCVRCERPPRVPASFLGRLPRAVNVPRRSLQELSGFRQASLFQRGQSFNASDGRFTAPLHAFYQLSANLLLQSGDRVLMRPRDNVRAAICLNSLCQSNLRLVSTCPSSWTTTQAQPSASCQTLSSMEYCWELDFLIPLGLRQTLLIHKGNCSTQ